MIIFHVDLDSTLIYSDKHDIHTEKLQVEKYDGGSTYITKKTLDGILKISDAILIVPTTTRSEKLYNRINLQGCTFKYALVANGALLLENGLVNEEWKKETQRLIQGARTQLEVAKQILENDFRKMREVEYIADSFLFTKIQETEKVAFELSQILDSSKVTVRIYKSKLYVLPTVIEKGVALERFKKYISRKEKIKCENIKQIAAGDGEFDISMIEEADVGIAYYKLKISPKNSKKIVFMGENQIFSDEIVDKLKEISLYPV
ncbi:MAG: HAD hydrolase family protein [Eubacteriales bacterium]